MREKPITRRLNKFSGSSGRFGARSALAGCFVALGALLSCCFAEEEGIRVSADNQLYYAHDMHPEDSAFSNLFEDWATVTLGYGNFEANMTYEAHLPPPSWSKDTAGQGIYERWFSYKRENLKVTVGNFYALLGKGITLRSFNNREMRYNSNIDGVQFQWSNNFVDFTALGGRPRDFSGLRLYPLQGGEVRVSPVKWGFLGATYVQSRIPSTGEESRWASGYLQLQKDFGSIYTEVASRDFGKDNGGTSADNLFGGTGTAFYSTANLFFWKISALFEVAYYNSFDMGQAINTPPSSILEHSTALMTRVEPEIDDNNYNALHTEIIYAVNDDDHVSLSFSRTRATNEEESGGVSSMLKCFNVPGYSADYSDIFLKSDFVYPSSIDWTLGSGYQQTVAEKYLNFVLGNDWGVAENYSIQGEFEHQWTEIVLTERKYYSQLYSITLARASAPRISLALIGEIVVDPVSKTKNEIEKWLGTQVNWTFLENNELTVFVGKRKKGKICAGGVCVNKPEFSGVEVMFTSKL